MEEKAARAYDLAALKYWGPSTHINSPVRQSISYYLIILVTQNENFIIIERNHMICLFVALGSLKITEKN